MIPRNRPYYTHQDLLFIVNNILIDKNEITEICKEKLKKILKFKYILFSSFGRASIKTVLEALDIANSRIILPAYICRVVADGIIKSNNYPAFVDINLDSFTMNPDIKDFIDTDTKAIVPALLYGNPYEIDGRVLRDERILLIEDACMAFGNKKLNSYHRKNSVAVFSFNIGKTPCSINGSLICTNDKKIYYKLTDHINKTEKGIKLIQNFNIILKFLLFLFLFNEKHYKYIYLFKKSIFKNYVEDTSNNIIDPGSFNFKDMTKCSKLILLSQLSKLEEIVQKRKALFFEYTNRLKHINSIILPKYNRDSSLSNFTILAERRDELNNSLINSGVETIPAYHYSLPELPEFRHYNKMTSYPNASIAARKSLCLPFYNELNLKQAARISNSIQEFYKDD